MDVSIRVEGNDIDVITLRARMCFKDRPAGVTMLSHGSVALKDADVVTDPDEELQVLFRLDTGNLP